jgi:phosphate transport system permease protein
VAGGAPRERWIERALFASAALSTAVTIGIVLVLAGGALSFFDVVTLGEFATGTVWAPELDPPRYGVLPLLSGTLLVAGVASIIALPSGIAAGIFLGELATRRVRTLLAPTLRVLAGVPTVVYGWFALSFVNPLLRSVVEGAQVFNAAAASLVVAIMILPLVASMTAAALRGVPDDLREAAASVGATRMETVLRVLVPAARGGILAACGLALSRAIGETMIVALVAGALANLTADPLEPVLTMTAFLVQIGLGDAAGTLAYPSLFAVGSTLFLLTLALNLASRRARGARA